MPVSVDGWSVQYASATGTGAFGSNTTQITPLSGNGFFIQNTAVGRSEWRDLWVVANHFSSGPDSRVDQRREQAAYKAAIAKAIEADDAAAKVVVAGDLNVYPRPDDPFDPPSDQLGPLYDAGLHNLFDTAVAEHPSSACSYVYRGQAQTLDQQFVSPALFADLKAVNEAHVNSDWTPDVATDGNRLEAERLAVPGDSRLGDGGAQLRAHRAGAT